MTDPIQPWPVSRNGDQGHPVLTLQERPKRFATTLLLRRAELRAAAHKDHGVGALRQPERGHQSRRVVALPCLDALDCRTGSGIGHGRQ